MPDREKVIKGLEWVLNDIEENGHYHVDYYADEIRDALSLLKEQEAVVHCGDCENFCFDVISPNAGHCVLTNEIHSKNWFCAHGKREEGD